MLERLLQPLGPAFRPLVSSAVARAPGARQVEAMHDRISPRPRALRASHVGLVVALAGIVALVALDDTGHLGWAVRIVTSIPLGDKVGHFAGFGTLAFFAARVFPSPRLGPAPIAVLVLLALTGLEELSQTWVPWRHCDPWDFVADTLGMATMTALALAIPSRRERVNAA